VLVARGPSERCEARDAVSMEAPWRRVRLSLAPVGLAVVVIYLLVATGVVRDTSRLLLFAVFAIGPVAIVGVHSLGRRLSEPQESFIVEVGCTFLIIAFAILNLFIVVQQYVGERMRERLASTAQQVEADVLREAWHAVDLVQQGMDVSFDIFYCLGLILVSIAMFRHRDFGKLLGGFGVAGGGALLTLNLVAFPYIPSQVGLVDLGPITGLWWLAVIVQMLRIDRRGRGGNEALQA